MLSLRTGAFTWSKALWTPGLAAERPRPCAPDVPSGIPLPWVPGSPGVARSVFLRAAGRGAGTASGRAHGHNPNAEMWDNLQY